MLRVARHVRVGSFLQEYLRTLACASVASPEREVEPPPAPRVPLVLGYDRRVALLIAAVGVVILLLVVVGDASAFWRNHQ
jgi:hypothetical protein